jgi:hypothetical protein
MARSTRANQIMKLPKRGANRAPMKTEEVKTGDIVPDLAPMKLTLSA